MNWQPSATINALRKRAEMLCIIRNFLTSRGCFEVETPLMAQFGVTDVYLTPIKALCNGAQYCLQTSPEYHMKRLLAAGSGPIFQIGKAFRDDELGRWHNPEFTMLEWYQPGYSHHDLLEEVDALLQLILGCPALIKKTYKQAFQEVCGLNPFTASIFDFKTVLLQVGLDNVLDKDELDRDQYLFLLMSHIIEPHFADALAPLAIYNFPPSQAALAQIKAGEAERFEVYFKGVELANGFHELTEPQIQYERFQQDIAVRVEKGLPEAYPDTYLIEALHAGIPACSGVALGVDRLIALALGYSSIQQVQAFDVSRA